MKSRLLIASAVIIAAMMLMSPFAMNGEDNIMLGDVEGGVCIDELSVIDGVLCDSTGQAFDVATPILIDDENDLRKLSELVSERMTFLNYSLYLTSNIKMTDEFDPIGNYDVRFRGTFDGQGYTISNLTVNISNNNERICAGLFGCIGQNGVVENVGLIDSNISAELIASAEEGSYAYVGSIAGYNNGIIENCYNTGNINASSGVSPDAPSSTYSYAYAGGIVGRNNGDAAVFDCYNTGNISAKSAYNAYASGIAGRNSEGGLISDCHNAGTIFCESGEDYVYAGGIVGRNYGTIENCYNTGNINAISGSSDAYAGGIAGWNSGIIQNCYNNGKVSSETCMEENIVANSATAYTGGISGYNLSEYISHCYNTGEISATNNANTTIDDDETKYVDNFAAAGGIVGNATGGSVNYCYNTGNVISTANTAAAIASGITGSDNVDISNSYNIGNITSISKSGLACAGGIASYLVSADVVGCYNTGKIAASSETDIAQTGGIAGIVHSRSTIISSYNTGDVTSESVCSDAGGIAGMNNESLIRFCYNLGNVAAISTLKQSSAGGIVGWIFDINAYNGILHIYDCYNMGNIQSISEYNNAYAGGIAGYLDEVAIYFCYNLGDVVAHVLEDGEGEFAPTANAGGIAGRIINTDDEYIKLRCCYNAGSISAYSAEDACVGGIAGCNESSIAYVYNTGKIYVGASGSDALAGGIAGYNQYEVSYCYNIGGITSSELTNAVIGSIVGMCVGEVKDAYFLEETADVGIGQCADEDICVSLTSEEMKGWKLLGYESEYNLNMSESDEYLDWLPDIFNANNGYPILGDVPIHTQSAGEIPLSATYILIGNETTQAENYLKPYTSKTPAVEMHVVFGDLQNLEGFSSGTPTYEWHVYDIKDILSEAASFTPSEFGMYAVYMNFEDENGNKYSYYLLPRIISEAIEYTISFEVPEDAEVTVKDSSGNVVSAESDGTYLLETGEYTYTVTKEGYKTVEDKLTVTVFDASVPVSLEEKTNTIYYIIAAIVVILVVVAIAYFITKKK